VSGNRRAWGEELRGRLQDAIAADLRALTDGVADTEVLGVGAYTDADASNVAVAVQTRAAYDSLVERRPQYRSYFRWSLGEWDRLSFEELDDDALAAVNAERAEEVGALEEGEALDSLRSTVWNAVVDAIAGAAAAVELDRFPHAVRVFEPVDADVSEDEIRAWTARINDAARMAEYDAWAANPSS
jgi:hypothetical protein